MHTMYQYEDLKLVRLSEVNRSKLADKDICVRLLLCC